MLPFNLPETLRYGIIGLSAILGILAFTLLAKEQKKARPSTQIITAIYGFMAFSIVLLLVGILSDTLKKTQPPTDLVDFKSGFSKNALNGTYIVDGNDLDFPNEKFKTPRHKYKGELEIRQEKNQILLEGELDTVDALTDTVKGKGRAIFSSNGIINDEYVAGQYFYGSPKVNGFGTTLIKFQRNVREAKMYCLFRTTSGDADIGLAIMRLKRKY